MEETLQMGNKAGNVSSKCREVCLGLGIMLTHCGRVAHICVFTLQLYRTGDADLRFYVTTVQDG